MVNDLVLDLAALPELAESHYDEWDVMRHMLQFYDDLDDGRIDAFVDHDHEFTASLPSHRDAPSREIADRGANYLAIQTGLKNKGLATGGYANS